MRLQERFQHTALLSLTEEWKKALDNKGLGGAVLMDLSKAFDTVNHDLLIAKLHADGFNKGNLKFLFRYLNNRWHRAEMNQNIGFMGRVAPKYFSRICPWSSSIQY